jgi:very-short-patch-repair endonuclease
MNPLDALQSTGHLVATTQQLLGVGMTPKDLTRAVRTRALIRIRRGHYAAPATDDLAQQAVRVGGRLTCISALRALGVWVPDDPFPHVALRHQASRLRSPRNRFVQLSDHTRDGATLHWWPLVRQEDATQHAVHIVDALIHIIRCQAWHLAVAALDSAMHQKLVTTADIDLVFATVPEIHGSLKSRLDRRCESGIETIVRLLLEELGLPFELQRKFRGVGFVDFVVAGCVVIETDGHLGHEGEEGQLRDYARDTQLAIRGYIVLRFNYRQAMFERQYVVEAILAALRTHRAYRA